MIPRGYRAALDGLRGIAVAAVIGYHLDISWLRGGFLGVDLFFVLSGYLITSLLLIEVAGSGKVDLPAFWARRARRLLPASLVTIVCTAVLMPEVNGYPTKGDALSSVAYFANWHFIAQSRSYFAALSEASPFRHMWSLAIEEQFYLLWPLAFAWLARRRSVASSLTRLGIAGVVLSATLMAVLYSPTDPSRSYYGTDTRVHELLIGVLLAVALSSIHESSRVRRVLRVAGPTAGALIIASIGWMGDESAFYYRGGSVVFAICVAIVIAWVEVSPNLPVASALGAAPLRGPGVISYGLYLWHWPVVVFVGGLGLSRAAEIGSVLITTAALSVFSYRFIERPIRSGRIRSLSLTPGRLARVVPVVMAVAAVFVLATAPEADQWVGEDGTITAVSAESGGVTYGLVGDSVAASLAPGLEGEITSRGDGFVGVARRGCAVIDGFQVDPDGEPFAYSQACDDWIPDAFDELLNAEPNIIVWYSARETNVTFLVDDRILSPGTPEHDGFIERGLSATIDRLTSSGAQLVIIQPLPPYGDACVTRPDSDACDRVEALSSARRRLTSILQSVAGNDPRVVLLDARDIVCGTTTRCERDAVGDLRPDGNHFTDESAALVAAEIVDRVDAAVRSG